MVGGVRLTPTTREEQTARMAIYGIVGADGSSWETSRDDADYNPDEFYTRATNKHDHSTPVSVRLDPTICGQMDALIASRDIPHYRTRTDIIRDAIYHRLHYVTHDLNVGDDEFRELLTREREQARMEQARAQCADIEKMIDTARANLADAAAKRDTWLLEATRESLQRQLDTLREPYRSQVRTLLNTI